MSQLATQPQGAGSQPLRRAQKKVLGAGNEPKSALTAGTGADYE